MKNNIYETYMKKIYVYEAREVHQILIVIRGTFYSFYFLFYIIFILKFSKINMDYFYKNKI